MKWALRGRIAIAFLIGLGPDSACRGEERTERFEKDPGWEARNNRSGRGQARTVRQDFGFSRETQHAAGRAPGEMGGVITPAAEPAYYAKKIPTRTFRDPLSASGTLSCGAGPVHVLIAFFNAATVNEWRTPNTIALRIQGRGDRFFGYVEYTTARWRAGGDEPRPFARVTDKRTGKTEPRGFEARGTSHRWSLNYDPRAAEGRGAITATIDGETSVCELAAGHKADGASFDRFGVLVVSKSADSPGELWLDDLNIDGAVETFTADPRWENHGNRHTYDTTNIRPRFDFGFSPTQFSGGVAPGELGGLVFRGDIRYPDRMAAYGARLKPLRLDRSLRASGTIALRRAVSDSTSLLGFYHSQKSLAVNPSQVSGFPEHFLGLAVEGPSREGFFVYPAFRLTEDRQGYAHGPDLPRILPDGTPHHWTMAYQPAVDGQAGALTLSVDRHTAQIELRPENGPAGPAFDRFGIITTWIDGNGQSIYFDDLTYTSAQDEPGR
jgi:hypothetical protein